MCVSLVSSMRMERKENIQGRWLLRSSFVSKENIVRA